MLNNNERMTPFRTVWTLPHAPITLALFVLLHLALEGEDKVLGSGLQTEDQLLLSAWVPGLGPGCPGFCPPALFAAPYGHSSSMRIHKGLAQGRAGRKENRLLREKEMVGTGYL